jgi:intraflagellar transport protein 172
LFQVVFYDAEGGVLQHFDYSGDENVREFTTASFNPSGETVVVGSFNRYYVFSYNMQRAQWEQVLYQRIPE